MDRASEQFFIDKIRQGLQGSSSLSSNEEELLLTPVEELMASGKFSPDQAQSLQEKCISALTTAYNEDTNGKNKGAAIKWAEYNRNLYMNSGLAISGVVQNWYLSIGRSLEKQTVRGAGFWVINAILLAVILSVVIWLLS